jgi:hypothetical protein
MRALTAHIVETVPAQAIAAGTVALVCAVVGFAAWLALQHHVVKHGRVRVDRIVRATAVIAALVIGAAAVPGSAASQDREVPVGLPDLISDPPFIWFNKTVELSDGSIARVMSFDGYLRNNGIGVLELYGNPQIPGDVKQRWWDGEEWVEVATPRVLYETSDGHNHFHLMAAAEYELWDEGRINKVGESSKVGFCLLDSEQRVPVHDEFYDINTYNYCEANNPDAELLRMGITPGWVDLYDANTTLQWVDISSTQPGWYWVGAIIDPDDQIVESDETNNGLVFSSNKFEVPGAVARELPMQVAGEQIELAADLVGTVGDVVWMVTAGPSNGSLDVPIGDDFFQDTVRYTPHGDFEGIDSFSVAARDLSSPYPTRPTEVTIQVDASSFDGQVLDGSDGGAATELNIDATVLPESFAVREWEYAEFDLVSLDILRSAETENATWLASGLPAGLRIDRESGVISGVPALSDPGTAAITVQTPDATATFALPWSVTRPAVDERHLDDLNDLNTSYLSRVRLPIGRRIANSLYEARGLPDGVDVSSNVPRLSGTPTEAGEFEVEITATIEGEVVDSTSFTWTIRPAAVPAFAL